MPTPYAGSSQYLPTIAVPADGDPGNGATFVGMENLADRTAFLVENAGLAIANPRWTKSVGTHGRFRGVCWAPGGGPFDRGMFVAAGIRDGGGAGVSLSMNGLLWYDYSWPTLTILAVRFNGVAHGGSGAFGSRTLVFCGRVFDGANNYAVIMSAPDGAANGADSITPGYIEGDFSYEYTGAVAGDELRSIAWNGTVYCAVGDGGLIVTLSGDLATATVRTPGSSYTGGFQRVFAVGSTFIAVGFSGEIQRSTNNGVTWTRVHSNAAHGTLNGGTSVVVNGVTCLVVGGAGATGYFLRSIDGGATWTPIGLGAGSNYMRIYALGPVLCAIVGTPSQPWAARSYYSFDGGLTWPLWNEPEHSWGLFIEDAASNGECAVIVGGTTDDGTGTISVTPRIIRA